MKKLIPFAVIALFFSCQTDPSGDTDAVSVTTINADDITYKSAVLKAKANLPKTVSSDLMIGFQYSTVSGILPSNSTTIEAELADADYNFSTAIEDLEPETTYYFRGFVRQNGQDTYGSIVSFTTCALPLPEKVDLGMVITRKDGTKYALYWADRNLGANEPEEVGNHYAWGEIEPKDTYSWENYKWAKGNTDKLTKYCPVAKAYCWAGSGTPDGKSTLEAEDDAAYMFLGGSWRIPTDEEWTWIRSMYMWSWTSINGVNGYMVTGQSGKSIFLPVTDVDDVGPIGLYWSSSLYEDRPWRAYRIGFYSNLVDRQTSARADWRAIRPVFEVNQ